MTRPLHIQGTASHAGKSLLTAAFGCWLRHQGLRVAPFKAQNMSLNSFVTLRGEEIARSQATQAEALGLEPTADMNPVLLKPMGGRSQVVVQGQGVGVMTPREYYAFRPHAWQAITESYARLAAAYDAIVLEGAGSPVEINLKEYDLVNMRMAAHAGASVVLVADIERGGVFAQLVGTWELLDPSERERVVGFLINKFRGDVSLLDPGLTEIRRRTGRPVLGVLPFDAAVTLEEEDSLGIPADTHGEIEVAVVCLPGLSNFTDFDLLSRAPGVGVCFVRDASRLHDADIIILPGTRTTVRALEWLHGTGLGEAVRCRATDARGPLVVGLCGGYQLLGRTIADPHAIESSVGRITGLGLLDVETQFEPGKLLYRATGQVQAMGGLGAGCPVTGYEVHQGTTQRRPGVAPWLRLRREPGGEEVDDGAVSADGRVCGSYLHGLFDDARFCRALIEEARRRRGLAPLADRAWHDRRVFWANRHARLAGWLTEHCDLAPVASALGLDTAPCQLKK